MDLISNDLFFIKNEQCRTSKMTQKVKELGEVRKPDDLSSIPESHSERGGVNLECYPLTSTCTPNHVWTCSCTHTLISKIQTRSNLK